MLKRETRFGFVLSTDERTGLRQLAEQEGLSEAAILRRLIRKAARELVQGGEMQRERAGGSAHGS